MKTLRVILLAGLIFGLGGSAFAAGTGDSQGGSGNNNNQGYQAPELEFIGSLPIIAGGVVFLLERRRRRRRASLDK